MAAQSIGDLVELRFGHVATPALRRDGNSATDLDPGDRPRRQSVRSTVNQRMCGRFHGSTAAVSTIIVAILAVVASRPPDSRLDPAHAGTVVRALGQQLDAVLSQGTDEPKLMRLGGPNLGSTPIGRRRLRA
jgi:hypothetical protein